VLAKRRGLETEEPARDVGGEASHTEKTFWYVANPACEGVLLFRLLLDFVVQDERVGDVRVEP